MLLYLRVDDRQQQQSPKEVHGLIDVDHEDTILRSFILFVQTAYAILKYADAHLYRKAHLSVVKLVVMRTIASNNGVITPSELAKWTQTERHNITTVVERMKRDGLIRTERNPRNRRFVNISLTDKGREVLTQAMPVAREIVDQVMSSISEDDALLLEKSLRALRQNAHLGLEHVAKRSQP
jgi:MarR family 2-MHQ and catechol resistance regulon transcriptional repressor